MFSQTARLLFVVHSLCVGEHRDPSGSATLRGYVDSTLFTSVQCMFVYVGGQ